MILEHIAEESTRSLHLRSAVQREVLADGENIADELVISVYTCREAFKVSSVYDTEILIVSEREIAAPPLSAVADTDVVVLHHTGACCLLHPVSI